MAEVRYTFSAITLASGWARVGGSSDLNAISTDNDDTSYIWSGTTDEQTLSTGFIGATLPSGAVLVTVSVYGKAKRNGGSAATARISIDGGGSEDISLGTSYAEYGVDKTTNDVNAQTFRMRGLSFTGFPLPTARVSYLTRAYTYHVAPLAPTLTSPANNSRPIAGFNFTGSFNTPAPGGTPVSDVRDSMNAVQIEVRRNDNDALIADTGWVADSGVGWSHSSSGMGLVQGITYKWRARNRNSFGDEGAWSSYITFRLNEPPTATQSTPAADGTVSTLTPTFTGGVSDTDGDAVNAVWIEVRRVSDNALFWDSGWLSNSGSTYSKQYTGTTLVDGVQYKWRVKARQSSGSLEGSYTAYRNFTVQLNAAPTASQVSPAAGAQVSLTPSLTVGFSDPDSGTAGEFGQYQYEVRRVSDQVTFWNPGAQDTTAGEKTANQATVVYAGTTLISGTVYEWRVRVADSLGLFSAYTGWRSFTAVTAADPPTLSSPSGKVNTLTPTIQGAYNQGGGGTEAAFQYEVRQGITTIYQSGDVATAIATGQAYGTDNPSDTPAAPPALAWGTQYQIRARSKDNVGVYSDWTSWVNFNTDAAPTTPTGRNPNGSIINDTTPLLSWVHNDPDGDAQEVADIELRLVSDNSVVTGYGPKTLNQSTLSHSVTETLTISPPTEYKWRIRTRALAGPGYGPYSDYATFTVANVPTLTVTAPAVDEVVTIPGYTVTWTFSGGSGTQQDYRVRVYADDGVTVLYDSGVIVSAGLSQQIPFGTLMNGNDYFVRVNVKDTLDQEADSGLIPFSTAWTPPHTIEGLTAVAFGSQHYGL